MHVMGRHKRHGPAAGVLRTRFLCNSFVVIALGFVTASGSIGHHRTSGVLVCMQRNARVLGKQRQALHVVLLDLQADVEDLGARYHHTMRNTPAATQPQRNGVKRTR